MKAKPKFKFMLFVLTMSILLLGGCSTQDQQNMSYIGSEQAKTAALQDAGLTTEGVVFSDVTLDKRNGLAYYDIEFSAAGQKYEYDIDALTGKVLEKQVPSPTTNPADGTATPTNTPAVNSNTTGLISVEEGKAKALSHAGLTEAEVSFVKAKLEIDNGKQIYDVEFYTKEGKEYDYEIDALTGEVISHDFDADSYTPSQSSDKTITADKAKEIALGQIPGATTKNIVEFETDYDDGKMVFEGKIIYDKQEYEFEIDGYSGAIRSWESEPINH